METRCRKIGSITFQETDHSRREFLLSTSNFYFLLCAIQTKILKLLVAVV